MDKNNEISIIFKILISLLCIASFWANSFMIFKQFIGDKTITSQDVQKDAKLFLPSMTLCGLNGYKEEIDSYNDLQLENYLNNTIGLEEILISVAYPVWSNRILVSDIDQKATDWKLTTTYSRNRGRCHTIQYNQEVKKLSL